MVNMQDINKDNKKAMSMVGASKLTYLIRNGKLPVNYQLRIDEWIEGKPVNWYYLAGFTGKVYTFTAGIENIHAALMGIAGDKLIIAFRGTEGNGTPMGSILDWLNNFLAMQVSFAPYGAGKVHTGFFSAAEDLKEEILEKTEVLFNKLKDKYESPEIILTGHSKGGAVAEVMAAILAGINEGRYREYISVYTFGAPRVGDEVFANNYKLKHLRYEAFLDIVCHLPFTLQEAELLRRLGPIQELFEECFKLEPYSVVGEYICIYHQMDNFGNYPPDVNNAYGETLNSFCAIEQAVRYEALPLLAYSHDKDYYLLDKSIRFH